MSALQRFRATPAQIKLIHTLKSRAGLAEEDYRAALKLAGAGSSKQLSGEEADAFIAKLRAAAPAAPPRVKGALNLSGPYAGKLRALWIAGWDLGTVRDRTDTAMAAFLERQTGLSAPNFLSEPREARKVIEALKKWLAREAGVDWTHARGADPAREQRLAVIRAQWAILDSAPASAAARDHSQLTNAGLDRLRSALGREIRAKAQPLSQPGAAA